MLKKRIAPVILAVGIAGALSGVGYAAAASHSGTPTPSKPAQTQPRTQATATPHTGCMHDGSSNTAPTSGTNA